MSQKKRFYHGKKHKIEAFVIHNGSTAKIFRKYISWDLCDNINHLIKFLVNHAYKEN